MPNFCLATFDGFGFCGVFGLCLRRLCLGYLGVLCGLKHGFHRETKCEFLGFWIEQESIEKCLGSFR